MIHYLYTLKHPITNEIRYVGKTINLKRRYKQHLYDKRTTHKSSWVKSLKVLGLKPILTVIEECTVDTWQEREKYWITQFNNLTNQLDGGGANYIRTTKDETRKKISLIHKGIAKTKQHKDKIKLAKEKKPCIIDKVHYESTCEASRLLSIPNGTLFNRLNNKNYPNYIWSIQ